MIGIHKFITQFSFLEGMKGFIMGFIAPIMYVVLRGKGFEILEIGLLILCTSLTTVLLEVPCGVLSDRIGRKKLFLLGQLFFWLFCLSMFLSDSLTVIFVAMTLAGLSAAMVSGTLDAVFVETIKKENESPEFLQITLAKVGACSMLGMFVGAILSGVLIKHELDLTQFSGFEKNYGIVSILLPAYMVLVALLVKEPDSIEPGTPHKGLITLFREAFVHLMKHSTLKLLMASGALGATAYISFEKFWQLQLVSYISDEELKWIFGALFAGSIVISAVGQALSNSLCKLFNNNYVKTNIFIRIVHAFLFSMLFFTEELWFFISICILIFFVSALSSSPVMTLLHSEIEDSQRSTMLSFRSVFLQLGAAVGIVIASLVSHFTDLQTAFLFSASLYILSLALLMTPSIVALGYRLSEASMKRNP